MEMLCIRCVGSGWEDKKFVPFNPTKQVFVLIPCKLCKGSGKMEIKEEKDDGRGSRDVL